MPSLNLKKDYLYKSHHNTQTEDEAEILIILRMTRTEFSGVTVRNGSTWLLPISDMSEFWQTEELGHKDDFPELFL